MSRPRPRSRRLEDTIAASPLLVEVGTLLSRRLLSGEMLKRMRGETKS